MNAEQTLNAAPPAESTSVGRLRVAEEHARDNWRRLVEHAQGGRCTCHLGIGGSVHVLAACYTGRMLYEEYWIAAERVRELSPCRDLLSGPALDREIASRLEAGDFDGRDPEPICAWCGGRAADCTGRCLKASL